MNAGSEALLIAPIGIRSESRNIPTMYSGLNPFTFPGDIRSLCRWIHGAKSDNLSQNRFASERTSNIELLHMLVDIFGGKYILPKQIQTLHRHLFVIADMVMANIGCATLKVVVP